MKSAVKNTLVFPVNASRVAAYVYYLLEGTGDGEETLCARALRERDFVGGARWRIGEGQLAGSIRDFCARDVYDCLCARMKERAKGDVSRLGIAAYIRIDAERFCAVPLSYVHLTGAAGARLCILRLPAGGIRYDISDSAGSVSARADAKELREMLLAPLAEDLRSFHMEVPARCLLERGTAVYVLLPASDRDKGRLCLRADMKSVMLRKLKNHIFLDIRHNSSVDVRSLEECRVWSLHASLLHRMLSGRQYSPSDKLCEVAVSAKAVKAACGEGLELRMPQMWRVRYKDSVLSLPWTALSHSFRKTDSSLKVLLCSGMYELKDEGARYEVCMEDLADALDGNEYRTEPRMYVRVPYRAVIKANSRLACIGLVLAGMPGSSRHKAGEEDFSCIMNVDSAYYVDERSIGGRIWLAVPVGYRFVAFVPSSGAALEMSAVDVMKLLGLQQKDYEAASAAAYAAAVKRKREERAAA